jgi:hypothetical protein
MALANTGRAIGAITQTLRERLTTALGAAVDLVSVGRPEPPAGNIAGSRLNLFLYEIHVDEFLHNVSLDEGQPPPLWLALRYLATAFDSNGESDSIDAHAILGAGMRALQGANFLQPTAGTIDALRDNPNELKVTFDAATVDLISKLMQGPDMKYRCSAAFEVRPVLVAPALPAAYSQLVGIDYTKPAIIGEKGVQIVVEPSLGPLLDAVSPSKFEVGATLQITGNDLHLEGISIQLGPTALTIVSRTANLVQATVPLSLAAGNVVSAGSLPLTAVLTLPNGHTLSSNAVTGGLLPRMDTVTVTPGTPKVIDFTGVLLGTATDTVFAALSLKGTVVRVYDQFTRPTADQTTLRLTLTPELAVPAGTYRVILRVNGQQTLNSPEVVL